MMRRALTNTGWLMGARTINAVLSLVYLALATRALGLEGFGQFVLIFTFAQVVGGFTAFQTWQAVIRWGQVEQLRSRAVGFALGLDLVTVAAGTAAAALLLTFAGDWLPIAPEYRGMTFVFTVAYLLAIRSTPTGILRLHDRYASSAAADTTLSIVRVIGALLASLFAPSIPVFLIIWAVAELLTAAMYWRLAARAQPIGLREISLLRLPSEEEKAWSFVAGTSLTAMLSVASRQVIVLLIGALGGAALAGLYRVAMQIGEGVLKLAQALLRATYPELVRDPGKAAQIAQRMTRLAMATGLAAVLLALLAGEWLIVAIAGAAFLPAYWPLVLLAGAAALELAGASFEALIVARGQAVTVFVLRLVPTVAAIGALPWLIGAYGATGAAMAVLGASVVSVCGFTVAASRGSAKAPGS